MVGAEALAGPSRSRSDLDKDTMDPRGCQVEQLGHVESVHVAFGASCIASILKAVRA